MGKILIKNIRTNYKVIDVDCLDTSLVNSKIYNDKYFEKYICKFISLTNSVSSLKDNSNFLLFLLFLIFLFSKIDNKFLI